VLLVTPTIMVKATHHIPEGLSAVIPQLVVSDARALVEFARRAFGAEIGEIMPGPDGKGVLHGYFRIGGAPLFVSDLPGFAEPTKANLFIYVPDVDASVARAVDAGASVRVPVADMFWGDRWGMISDPWGNAWQVATHKERLDPEEMKRRMAANAAAGSQ
jgi:PhnB protein